LSENAEEIHNQITLKKQSQNIYIFILQYVIYRKIGNQNQSKINIFKQ